MLNDVEDVNFQNSENEIVYKNSFGLFSDPVQVEPDSDLAIEVLELFGDKNLSTRNAIKRSLDVTKSLSHIPENNQSRIYTFDLSDKLCKSIPEILRITTNNLKKLHLKDKCIKKRKSLDVQQFNLPLSKILSGADHNSKIILHDSSLDDLLPDRFAEDTRKEFNCQIKNSESPDHNDHKSRNGHVKITGGMKSSDINDGIKLRISNCFKSQQRGDAQTKNTHRFHPYHKVTNLDDNKKFKCKQSLKESLTNHSDSKKTRPRNNLSELSSGPDKYNCSFERNIRSMNITKLNQKAMDVKHKADKMTKCPQKLLFYLESICYYGVQASLLLILDTDITTKQSDSLLNDTIDLLRFTHSTSKEIKGKTTICKIFLQKFELLDQLITSFIYYQRWKNSLNNVRQLSLNFSEICSHTSSRSPTISPRGSVVSSSTGSDSPNSSELKQLCENLLHIVDRPASACANWKRAQLLINSSIHVKEFCEEIERRYKYVNYANSATECYTYLLIGIEILQNTYGKLKFSKE